MPIDRRTFALSVLALAVSGSYARAEMSWRQYLEMRDEASEVLDVTVASVSQTTTNTTVQRGPHSYGQQVTQVRATLTVNRIIRTQSRLSEGRTISLGYEMIQADHGFPSQFPPRLLKQGEKIRVYLASKGGAYVLAAGKASFE